MKSKQDENKFLTLIIYLVTLVTLIHTLVLLMLPNGIEGSNFLGYSRARFLVILFSAALTIGLWGIIGNITRARKVLDRVNFSPNLNFGILGVLCTLLTFGIQALIWPDYRLPTQILGFREFFQASIVWAVAVGFIFSFFVLLWPAWSRENFVLKLILISISFFFINLRIENALDFRYPGTGGDGVQYIGFESLKFMFSQNLFWAGPRPFLLPFIGTLLKQNAYAFAWFQTVFSVFSWLFLAHVVSKAFSHSFWKIASFFTILLFSMSDRVFIWDWSILAESLSISLMALIIAGWILLFQQVTLPRMIFIICTSFLWAFTRDLNAWILLLIGVLVLLLSLAKLLNPKLVRINPKLVHVGLVYVTIFLANYHSVNSPVPPRWTVPFMHVLASDILPNNEALEFFKSNGMPTPRELLTWGGKIPDFDVYYYSPEFEGFRLWLFSRGQTTLAKYLINSIPESLYLPVNPENGYPIQINRPFGRTWDYNPLLTPMISGFVFFDLRNLVIILLVVFVIVYSCVRFWKTQSTRYVPPLVGIMLSYPYAFLAWHGDALERSRHVFPADILLRVSILILALFVIEDILHEVAQRRYRIKN